MYTRVKTTGEGLTKVQLIDDHETVEIGRAHV